MNNNADADEPLWSCPACGAPQHEASAFCADCERPCADDSPMEVTR